MTEFFAELANGEETVLVEAPTPQVASDFLESNGYDGAEDWVLLSLEEVRNG